MFGVRQTHIHLRRGSTPSAVAMGDVREEQRQRHFARLDKEQAEGIGKRQRFIDMIEERLMKDMAEGKIEFDDVERLLDELRPMVEGGTIKDMEAWERHRLPPIHGEEPDGSRVNIMKQLQKREMTGEKVKTRVKSSKHILDKEDADARKDAIATKKAEHRTRGLDLGGALPEPARRYKHGGIVKGKKGQAVPIVAHAGELVVPVKAVDKVLKSSAWIDHVKSVQKAQGISYKEAMKMAKGSYKK